MQFWDHVTLKNRAKEVLRGSYWWSLLSNILVSMLSSMAVSLIVVPAYIVFMVLFGINYSQIEHMVQAQPDAVVWGGMSGSVLLIMLLVLALSFVATIFVSNILQLGLVRFYSAARYNVVRIEELLYGFRKGYYLKHVKTMFLRTLYLTLWGLIPFAGPFIAIAKGYSYFMVPYIIAENPDIPAARAFEISEATTKGEKMEMFVLDLSFLGWYLLGVLACGIGELFVPPYHWATHAELYGALRYKAVNTGICDKSEIGADL